MGTTGRPSKFTPEKGAKIVERLRGGCTRKASAQSVGVSYNTFLDWLQKGEKAANGPLREFYEAAAVAEAEAEVRNTLILEKAANGYQAGYTTVKRRTVVRMKRTRLPDGTVIEEPITLVLETEEERSEQQFDYRAALEWLRRRNPAEWGDNQKLDIEVTDDSDGATLERKLARLAASLTADKDPGGADGAGEAGA